MKKPFFRQWWFWTGFVILIIVLAALATPEDKAEDKPTATVPDNSKEQSTSAKKQEPKEETKDLKSMAEEVSKKQLASVELVNYNPENGYLLIKGKGKENLSANMTTKGFKLSIFNIMKEIHDQKEIETLAFNITYPLTDKYGNASDQIVLKAEFSRATLDKIDYNNLNFENLGDVADSYWEHNALKK